MLKANDIKEKKEDFGLDFKLNTDSRKDQRSNGSNKSNTSNRSIRSNKETLPHINNLVRYQKLNFSLL